VVRRPETATSERIGAVVQRRSCPTQSTTDCKRQYMTKKEEPVMEKSISSTGVKVPLFVFSSDPIISVAAVVPWLPYRVQCRKYIPCSGGTTRCLHGTTQQSDVYRQ